MAGKGGGGAWKVAYADFVTAMMAFFLVMWICGQDQAVRKAVSYYFNEPFNTGLVGTSKQPSRTGSFAERDRFGNVPEADSAALGQGRKSHTPPDGKATATRLVSAWLRSDVKAMQYWEDQARQAREGAAGAKEVRDKQLTVEEAATQQLTRKLRTELVPDVAAEARGLQQDLLFEILAQVNWAEIAEDLLSR